MFAFSPVALPNINIVKYPYKFCSKSISVSVIPDTSWVALGNLWLCRLSKVHFFLRPFDLSGVENKILSVASISNVRGKAFRQRQSFQLCHSRRLVSACLCTFGSSLFNFLKLHCLAKDHWWGFITWNAHMVHIVN